MSRQLPADRYNRFVLPRDNVRLEFGHQTLRLFVIIDGPDSCAQCLRGCDGDVARILEVATLALELSKVVFVKLIWVQISLPGARVRTRRFGLHAVDRKALRTIRGIQHPRCAWGPRFGVFPGACLSTIVLRRGGGKYDSSLRNVVAAKRQVVFGKLEFEHCVVQRARSAIDVCKSIHAGGYISFAVCGSPIFIMFKPNSYHLACGGDRGVAEVTILARGLDGRLQFFGQGGTSPS